MSVSLAKGGPTAKTEVREAQWQGLLSGSNL